jgi:two-component system, LytTR family, response regulator
MNLLSSMYTCIIVDDEPSARDLLQSIIQDYCSNVEILALCDDLPTAVKAIKKHQPNLVFLDIELPGYSGLEIMDFFSAEEVNFSIIFTTAYNEYALQAFKLSAVDYLLKPIQHEELVAAVERFHLQNNQSEKLQALKTNLDAHTAFVDKRIAVNTDTILHFLKPKEIIMIKAEASYSEFFLQNGSTVLASKNLKHFEETLSNIPFFFRSHKSYIINLHWVKQYVKSEGGFILLENKLQAGVAADKINELIERLK